MSLVHVSELKAGDLITYRCEDGRGRRWQSQAEIVTMEGADGPRVTEPGTRVAEWEVPDEQILGVQRMTPQGPVALKVDAS